MAVIECPHCEARIPSDLPQCPKCNEYLGLGSAPVYQTRVYVCLFCDKRQTVRPEVCPECDSVGTLVRKLSPWRETFKAILLAYALIVVTEVVAWLMIWYWFLKDTL